MSQGVEIPSGAAATLAPPVEAASSIKLDLSRIAQDLQIRKVQVESVMQLLDEGNTVPFITRYRKERTGGLDEELIRQIQARVQYLRQLGERKQTILKSIESQGKLTDTLRIAILAAETSKRLEDLYLPYKPKKRTLATIARERGLESLAQAIWNRDPAVANLSEVVTAMVNPEKELNTPDDVLAGAGHILAEQIAETAEVRAAVRVKLWETGRLCTAKSDKVGEGQALEYKDYFQFTEPVRRIPPHRILAINRGEKENALLAKLEWDTDLIKRLALDQLPFADHPHAEFLKKITEDALGRLLLPSLEREIRRELTEEAEEHAVRVFARNLRSLLLQPPLRGRRVLAIDPAFRTGCKLAALDEVGNLLEDAVAYPFGKGERGRGKRSDRANAKKDSTEKPASTPAAVTAPGPERSVGQPVPSESSAAAPAQSGSALTDVLPAVLAAALPANAEPEEPAASAPPVEGHAASPSPSPESAPAGTAPAPETAAVVPPGPTPREAAKAKLEEFIRKHNVNVVAIGNGTACRETEELVSELIGEKLPDLVYVIVNEAGASVYSASPIGREEFPHHDATLRGTVSIGRRLQDPLSELVKIEPQNIGVGLYQHDIHHRRLKESLDAVIESCVNHVGVDLNTASVPLLRHVSGLNQVAARELVEFRKQHGPFKSREQLLHVPGIGPARFVQAAGFLKLLGGENPLDQTWIHPESYGITQRLLEELNSNIESLLDRQKTELLREKLKTVSLDQMSQKLAVGAATLHDILEALARPGRDPREDLPPPIFKKGILKLEDLQSGMELKGTVLNVVDFGAFVDIGLKDSGLVHISQMANRYIRNPYDVVAVGDVVTVWVLAVDHERRRVSLTMIKPGSERKPPERKPQEQQRPQGGSRPPRGRRPPARQPVVAPGAQGQVAVSAAPGGAQTAPPQPVPAQRAVAQRPPPRQAQPPQPRKPHREPPKPKLSKAALEGAAPLRTFRELKAFFEAQKEEPPQPPGPENEAPPPQT
jgi:uncharacterized protein